ncbi:YeeE/YedE family protein [Nocardioides flavescens]|uniref:YeeE/YedE family protein n=1 Tax=Nocardioides flavescens TaxID=2691959 RepID=A0A6L7EUC4_9ACTN|nr:YeeE/YedE family protein [Nocardioides flavescens]MXG89068.1 YeeE/YedE family protein [Nocardioides flavescens]
MALDHATQHLAPPPQEAPPPQVPVVLAGVGSALALGGFLFTTKGEVPGLLFVIGLALGLVLFHSRFGFTSAWRQLVAVRQGKALRAHMLMLAAACILFAPILATQVSFRDVPVTPSLAPISWGLFVGATIFGVGMQLGGSCASGTLFAIGSGQSAIVITLTGFVAGATLGAYHLPWWNSLPAHDPVSLTQWGGYPGALAISLTVMAAITALTYVIGRRGSVPPVEQPPVARGAGRVVRGSWPLWVGALLLAGLNALTLVVSGGAWGITFAFALWGSKLLELVGVDVLGWGFWQDPGNLAKFEAGIFVEKTSVMDLGIIVGALIASAMAGQWVLHRRIPARLALGAVIGGVLMGYGARLAYGCNIGSYFGGIASFSLHGWLWGVMAVVGTVGGLALRPLFGLTNPRPTDSVC